MKASTEAKRFEPVTLVLETPDEVKYIFKCLVANVTIPQTLGGDCPYHVNAPVEVFDILRRVLGMQCK